MKTLDIEQPKIDWAASHSITYDNQGDDMPFNVLSPLKPVEEGTRRYMLPKYETRPPIVLIGNLAIPRRHLLVNEIDRTYTIHPMWDETEGEVRGLFVG